MDLKSCLAEMKSLIGVFRSFVETFGKPSI